MIHDRKIIISVGANRKSMNWQRQELNYSDFIRKLETPVRSSETIEEFLDFPKSKQDELKDVGGFIGGALKGLRRKANNIIFRDLVTLDFDNISTGETENVIKKVMTLGCGYIVYSTRKHIEYKPRLRIIFPLNRSVSAEEYEAIARYTASKIGIEMADITTFEPERLMYWPSCSKDSIYIFRYEDKPFLSADGVLSEYSDWRDISSWPKVPGVDIEKRKEITKQQDPTTKRGLIGAFCKTYDIYAAMAEFIPRAYDETSIDNRFTYHEGSTTGGAIIYENGTFLYSHHATDPCCGQLVNSWDLVRLHKFHDLDEEANIGTPITSLPSSIAMKELARNDKNVIDLLNKERQEQTKEYFNTLDNADNNSIENLEAESLDNGEWRKYLTCDVNGNYEKTIANIVLILDNDIKFKNKIYFDEFANRGMVELPLPWEDGEDPRMWSDVDDAQLALRLEKEYRITGRDKIETALKIVAFNHRKNAVKEYITQLKWDGIERIPTLIHDYLGAEQNVYTEEIMKKALVAAISRAFSTKGVKFDNMIIFSGPQGIGKSTFLAKLGKDWFSDSIYSFEGKEAAELIQGTLINEISELAAFSRSETETVKQFLSKTHDIYRKAYGKETCKYPRRCIFFGTSNVDEFINDVTGGRRFWPIRVGEFPKKKEVFKDLDNEVDQIWAEAYWYYLLGEPIGKLSEKAEKIVDSVKSEYEEVSPKAGIIEDFLNMRIPIYWYSLEPREQKAFLYGSFKSLDESDLVEREQVCVAEIWQVCFGGDIKYLSKKDSLEISGILSKIDDWERTKNPIHFGKYGKQRGYVNIKLLNNCQVKLLKDCQKA